MNKNQKNRVAWLEGLGLTEGAGFEVVENGIVLVGTGELFNWVELKKKAVRADIEDSVEALGLAAPVERRIEHRWDNETLTMLNEDHIMGMVNPTISSNGEDDEILVELQAAQLEAQIKPMLRALEEPEVVMEPSAEQEEPLFMITNTGATGVVLSKMLRQEIAEMAREYFHPDDMGADVVEVIHLWYQQIFEPEGHDGKRVAWACSRYAAAVVRSLRGKARMGKPLAVNTYWA